MSKSRLSDQFLGFFWLFLRSGARFSSSELSDFQKLSLLSKFSAWNHIVWHWYVLNRNRGPQRIDKSLQNEKSQNQYVTRFSILLTLSIVKIFVNFLWRLSSVLSISFVRWSLFITLANYGKCHKPLESLLFHFLSDTSPIIVYSGH